MSLPFCDVRYRRTPAFKKLKESRSRKLSWVPLRRDRNVSQRTDEICKIRIPARLRHLQGLFSRHV